MNKNSFCRRKLWKYRNNGLASQWLSGGRSGISTHRCKHRVITTDGTFLFQSYIINGMQVNEIFQKHFSKNSLREENVMDHALLKENEFFN